MPAMGLNNAETILCYNQDGVYADHNYLCSRELVRFHRISVKFQYYAIAIYRLSRDNG